MKLQWCQITEMKNMNSFIFPKFYGIVGGQINNASNEIDNTNNSVHFVVVNENFDDYLVFFVESEVYFYSINYSNSNTNFVDFKRNFNSFKENSNILSGDITNKPNESQLETFIFKSKQSLDFISYNDKICFIKVKKSNNNFSQSTNDKRNSTLLISTENGEIFIININLTDFFIEIIFKFNIRQNFIHEYEILDFEEMNILLTIDKHLFLYEIYSRNSHINPKDNNPNHHAVAKNLLMRIEYIDERIIDAYIKDKHYVVIFTNKMIYFINLENDGSNEILFQKDVNDYHLSYSGILDTAQDKLIYIKADNSFCIHPLYEPQNKFTVTINTKNQLNKLNFYKVIYANDEIIAIINKKQTEIYFFNNKYKLISRESILLETPRYFFGAKGVIVMSYFNLNMSFRYKIGLFIRDAIDEKIPAMKQIEVSSSALLPIISDDGFDLNEIENNFVDNKTKFHFKKEIIKEKLSEINIEIRKFFYLRKGWMFYNYELFDEMKKLILTKFNEIKMIDGNINIQKLSNSINARMIKYFINFYGSYALKKYNKILNEKYFQQIYKEKIEYLIKIAYRTKDYEVFENLQSIYSILI